jgi:hypothetical protein
MCVSDLDLFRVGNCPSGCDVDLCGLGNCMCGRGVFYCEWVTLWTGVII